MDNNSISTTNKLPQTGMVRFSMIRPVITLSNVTVWRLIKDGRFPEPLRVSGVLRLWRVEEIREWMEIGPDEWKRRHPVSAAQGEAA
ncbi:helix-turn-helix transcriptional regulator [Paraburkholderia phosphatilytica]|uniref:helix-turn-helix transcriptional regulator n=1 Tax=Paraburkholderia phosphatilytica TaxID=2282883 RepID=UPI000E5325FA|nr:AlpA family phage regulatory protein [Paraburkholderia phosphatilytica]